MTYERLLSDCKDQSLDIFGIVSAINTDLVPDSCKSILLLGPHEPGFWRMFTQSPEYQDRLPDPLDRWSQRVVGQLATKFGGTAIFPSNGPPYPPFIDWAKRSGRAWQSPVTLLVHDRAGLMVSYRGAIALDHTVLGPPRRCCMELALPTICPYP